MKSRGSDLSVRRYLPLLPPTRKYLGQCATGLIRGVDDRAGDYGPLHGEVKLPKFVVLLIFSQIEIHALRDQPVNNLSTAADGESDGRLVTGLRQRSTCRPRAPAPNHGHAKLLPYPLPTGWSPEPTWLLDKMATRNVVGNCKARLMPAAPLPMISTSYREIVDIFRPPSLRRGWGIVMRSEV